MALVYDVRRENESPLHILLADDHPLVLKGLRTLIESQPGWEVNGEAQDGQEAVEKTGLLKPDVVVLDLSMPKLNGLDAARRILGSGVPTEVLLLTMHQSEELAREAADIGVRGYVLKSDPTDELVAAIHSLSLHKPFVSRGLRERVMGPSARHQTAAEKPILSPREREVVQQLAEGQSTKEVATSLRIAVKTAETHRANIMRKLQIRSASELVRYALRNNIVQP
jgi:DNA-binding NarL/FixJ family response regulator